MTRYRNRLVHDNVTPSYIIVPHQKKKKDNKKRNSKTSPIIQELNLTVGVVSWPGP